MPCNTEPCIPSCLPNPIATACEQSGGRYIITTAPDDRQNGYCEYPQHPLAIRHSYATHYNITYTKTDLDYFKTKSNIRQWLKTLLIISKT